MNHPEPRGYLQYPRAHDIIHITGLELQEQGSYDFLWNKLP